MFWYLIRGIWHLCCIFLLRWVLKPVTGSPRDSAFTIGYSPAGYESLGDSFYQRKTQQDPVGALMDAKVSPFVSPSVSLPSFAAWNLPDSSLSLSQFYHSLSLSLPARHHYSFYFDPSLRGRIAVWSICREEIQMHVGVCVCVRVHVCVLRQPVKSARSEGEVRRK